MGINPGISAVFAFNAFLALPFYGDGSDAPELSQLWYRAAKMIRAGA